MHCVPAVAKTTLPKQTHHFWCLEDYSYILVFILENCSCSIYHIPMKAENVALFSCLIVL